MGALAFLIDASLGVGEVVGLDGEATLTVVKQDGFLVTRRLGEGAACLSRSL